MRQKAASILQPQESRCPHPLSLRERVRRQSVPNGFADVMGVAAARMYTSSQMLHSPDPELPTLS
eukprot:2006163-Pyramimonas_sp.AAC.2